MKKIALFCVFFALCAAVMSAAADSVWMPVDDYFFETWQPESENTCTNVERKIYLAAGENGTVTAVRTPLDQTPLMTYPNGTEFIMDFFCGIGDDQWGTVRSVRMAGEKTFTEDYSGKSGYISQKDLVHAYDTVAFAELHSDSVYDFTEEFNVCEPHFPFVIWSYPGSGVQLTVVNDSMLDWFCHDYDVNVEYFPIHMDRVFYAEDGSHWISVKLNKPYNYGWLHYEHPMDGAIIQNIQ